MVREIVTIKDYHRLSQEYEHYLWHFVKKNQCESQLIIKPVLSYTCEVDVNPLSIILEATTIPYFESYVEDSFDFLYSNGIPIDRLWFRYNEFNPIIIGLNRSIFHSSTFETCYCVEGITELILKLGEGYFPNFD